MIGSVNRQVARFFSLVDPDVDQVQTKEPDQFYWSDEQGMAPGVKPNKV